MTARVLHPIQNIKHGIKKKDYYICWFLFNYPVIMILQTITVIIHAKKKTYIHLLGNSPPLCFWYEYNQKYSILGLNKICHIKSVTFLSLYIYIYSHYQADYKNRKEIFTVIWT